MRSEAQKKWFAENVEKTREYNKKSYLKKRGDKICIICGSIISDETNSYKYCSEECRRLGNNKRDKVLSKKFSYYASLFKEKIGCSKCGYNKCGDALVFHHKYGKDFTISPVHLFYMTERTQKELMKCVLLCMNCHQELHYQKRRIG